jgi:FkbM family methyltransferase
VSSYLLGKRYVNAKLPSGHRVLLRNATNDIDIIDEVYLMDIYNKCYKPKPGDTIFDVGAHIGIYTLRAHNYIGSSGYVYAFEPDPENFSLLQKNVAINNLENVKTLNYALSDHQGKLMFFKDPKNTGMCSATLKKGKSTFVAKTITLDFFMREYNIREVNFLKIDVEGHEYEVLNGGKSFLKVCKNVAIETHERLGGPPNDLITNFLEEQGFKVSLVNYSENNDLCYGWKS